MKMQFLSPLLHCRSRRREGSKMQQGFVAHVHWKQTQILLCEHDSAIGVMSSSWVSKQAKLI